VSPAELLQRFHAQGVELWAEGDRLRYRAKGTSLGPAALDDLRSNKQELLSLLRNTPEGDFAATSGQLALWLKQQMLPGTAAYNVALALRITSNVDTAALSRALNALAARHQGLRSTFIRRGEELRQIVHRRHDVPLEQVDATGLDEAELHAAVQAAYRRPFALETGPLFRAALFTQPAQSVLLLTVHHIVCDAWSFWVLIEELRALYAGETLPAPPAPFADFASVPPVEAHLAFWQKELDGAPAATGLTTDEPRPARASGEGASLPFTIPPDLLAQLKACARRHEVTLYTLLLTAWQALLARYTGESDLVIGTPTFGRDDQRFAGTVGYFVNMAALRGDLSGDPAFSTLLARSQSRVLSALAQPYPFPDLLDRLRIPRDPSRTPLFQVTFKLQQMQGSKALTAAFLPGEAPVDWGGLRISHFPLAQQEGQFDLSLEAIEAAGRLLGVLKYSTDLFHGETIQRLAGHYVRLLESAAADPALRLSTLALLTTDETATLEQWNHTATPYHLDRCLHHLFEDQVRRTPDAIALVAGDDSLTYAALNARANQLARELQLRGIGPESKVALCADRSLHLMIGLYAIVKAGAAWVPIDPEYPSDRIAYMIEDSTAALILTQAHLAASLHATNTPVLTIDSSSLTHHDTTNLNTRIHPDNLAYVIYTSGSTGRPKGAMNQHRGIVNRLLWMQQQYPLTPADAVLQKTPISFDVSVWELFWPLWTGARLVLAKPGGHREPAYLAQCIQQHRITTLHFVPSMLEIFIGEPATATCCTSVSRVIASGEELSYDLQQRFFSTLPCELHNLYGPTEAAVDVSYWPCDRNSLQRRVPIGKPIANLRLEVLDSNLQRTPIGVPGELYLGSVGVGRGYQGRPSLTAERFIPDPWHPGERLYRTGDQARWLSTGNVEYLGRLDSQVKLRGFRIELGEIEAALTAHPGVREAVVLLRNDPQRLIAYITGDATPDQLRTALAAKLPAYMVPSAFVPLDRLPLNANGKVDRKALPAPATDTADTPAEHLSWTEEIIAGIWCDVLKLRRVGRDESFFQLGGHSLLVMQVLARMRQTFQVELSVAQFFDTPTVAGLAAALKPDTAQSPAITHRPHPARPPLSFAQQRMFFLQQLDPESPFYNVPLAWQVNGPFDPEAFQRALDALIARHPALRTAFVDHDGEVAQHIAQQLPAPVTFTDLTNHPDPETEARRLGNQDLSTVFTLHNAPLLRVRLLRLAPDRHAIVIVLHHIVCDGWTLGLLSADLGALYGGSSGLSDSSLDPVDFALWQREWMHTPARETQLAYWRSRLDGIPPVLALPTDRPRPAVQRYRGDTVFFSLDAALSNKLKALSTSHNATLYMTLLAGFAVLLARYSGQDDIVIGTPVAGRSRAELETLACVLLNSLPMRIRPEPELPFNSLLEQVRRTALEAWAHQDLPFESLVDEMQPERSRGITPIFQVLLVLLNTPPESLNLGGATTAVTPFLLNGTTSKLDVNLTLRESRDGIDAAFEYDTDLFDRDTIERLAGHYVRLLQSAATNPTLRLSNLALLTTEETATLDQWNHTATPYHLDRCLHHLFEDQVRRTPDAIALVANDGASLTYADFNARANQLARELQLRGIGPESKVALCADRSLDLMIGLYAIVKAGAAWVPIDPEYPPDRIAYMIEDSAAALILTQAHLAASVHATLVLTIDSNTVAHHDTANLDTPVHPDNLAYVIYTSGSTGRPKGAMNQHRGIVNRLLWMQDQYPLTPTDAVLQKTPISFDVSVWELFWPLWTGARLVLAKRGGHREPTYLAQCIQQHRITTLHFVPSMLEIFIGEPAAATCTSLRRVIASGEELSYDLQQRFFSTLPCELHNLYGPTEAAVDVSYWPCDRNSPQRRVPIGKPIANLRLEVLDTNLQRTPIGVPGELYLGGVGVGRGYQGNPVLTAERFIPDPWHPGERLYRTGDQARWLSTGNIEYLGRLDSQVKLRGFRIELGEIEAALTAHPGVREAVVLLRNDPQRLVAYITGDATPDQLRTALAAKLPAYMVPSAFVPLDRLPLNTNGKVDRKALPGAPESRELQAFVAPRTPAEQALAAIWAELLNLPQVGIHDNFFFLGGDSIVSMLVVARARRKGYALTVADLFSHQTIAALAVVATPTGAPVPATAAPRQSRPLTAIEQWFFAHTTADPHHFNQSTVLETPSDLDPDRLAAALNAMLARHDALRSRYLRTDSEGWQWAPSSLDQFPLEIIDGVIADHAPRLQSSLSLEDGVLMRAALFTATTGSTGRLLLIFHHLVIDGVSWRILLDELQSAYDGLALPDTPASFHEWAAAQPQQPLPPKAQPTLPRDLTEGENLAASADQVHCVFTEEDTRNLRGGMQNALLDALSFTLTSWTGTAAVPVDIEAHGRDSLVASTIGWFTTIRTLQLTAGGVPQPSTAPNAAEVLFNYLGRFEHNHGWKPAPEQPTGPQISPRAQRTHLLEVSAYLLQGRLHYTFTYSSAIYHRATIENLATAFRTALGAAQPTIDESFPLSPMQEGMLFETLLAPGKGVYWQQWAFALSGQFDPALFAEAWNTLLARHEALRTQYCWEGVAKPVQSVRREATLTWESHDLTNLPPNEQATALEAYLSDDRHRPVDLTAAPLMRMALLPIGDGRTWFVWSHHHLLLDGWSMGILLTELLHLYQAQLEQRPHHLPDAAPYRDYIAWVNRQDAPAAERYWRDKLSGFRPATALTGGKPQAPDAAYAIEDLRLTAETTVALRDQARRHRVTISMLLQAAWSLVLSRCAGSDDVAFGVVAATRPADVPGIDTMVGLLINTVPLRIAIDRRAATAAHWIAQLRDAQAERDRYSHRSLAEIQTWSGLPRNESLFESVLVFENFPIDQSLREQAGPLRFSVARIDERPHYPLLLVVSPETELLVRFTYDQSRVDTATARSLAGSLQSVLEAMARSLDTPVAALPLLPSPESLNDTGGNVPVSPLHEAFETQAALTPQALAVISDAETITYDELNRRASQQAAELRARGVTTDSIVAVCLERSVEMVVALLAVLKAGAAYLPLDPGYPPERLRFMREDSQATLLITEQGIEGPIHPPSPAQSQPGPDNLAYVIYTSGSTGRPKGVMQTHRAIVNHMAWMQHAFPLHQSDRVLQKTPFSFDASVWEFYAPLFTGGVLVMARPGAHQEPALLIQTIQEHHVTILQLVPSQLSLLLAEESFAQCTSLRRVFCGGEALTVDLQRRFFATLPRVELVNLYGPTETCIDSTYHRCDPQAALVPIGRPVWQTEAWILNARMEPLPPGVRGELYLGGAGLARGYLRRPALTAERFVPNPFEPGTRLYRTGDLVRQLADGSIEYLGRADSQVKLRGFRVELEEIEAALAACDGVAQAAVIAAGDRLLGFFVPSPGASPEIDALRAHLQRLLPEHMVPGALLELDAFPLTPSGKIDRRALAGIDLTITAAEKQLPPPADPFHELIIEAFARVLAIDATRIGVHSNFFELGGHSLLATQLVSRIRALFKVDIRLRQFFEAPTPALLAEFIRTRKSRRALPPPITPRPEAAADAVLSFAQQRLWFLHQMESARAAYNIPAALRLRGPLNLHALQAAFTAILERHESLRTTFHVRAAGEPQQVIAAPAPFPLPVIDGAEPDIARMWAEETAHVFDLETGPLLHARLLRLDALHHVLFVNWHHIASDGWSISLFLREVAALYEAGCGGRPAQLPPLPVQYGDFAHWQRHWLAGDVLAEYLHHWTARLKDAPPRLNLPLDHVRPPLETYHGARQRLTIPPALSQELKALARTADATLFMTLLAAFAALLSRHSSQTDIVIGSPVANRNHAEIEGLIGVFVNNLALRVDLSGSPTFQELIRRVRDTALDAYSFQDLPFERLVEALQPQRNLSHSPIFQVLFSMQTRTAEEDLRAYGLTLQPLDLDTPVAKYDLSLYVTETPAGLTADFEYNTSLFHPTTIERLARQYEHLLAEAAAQPAIRVEDLDVLPAAQQQLLLTQAKGPAETLDGDLRLIRSDVPDRIAVTSGGSSLTYAELEARVDRLARGLAARGVGPEVLVGISMDRGLDMLIAALAVIQAGGAYVPLDPAFPPDRLRFMQQDSGVSLVLTNATAHDIAQGDQAPLQPAHPDKLAYVLYTSGSTGRPKGVQVTRRNLANFLRSMSSQPGLRPGDTLVAVTTLSFDIAALELYLPLVTGAHVVIATRDEAADGLRLLDLLRRSNATIMQATPATWRVLLESGWRGDPTLRVLCGGEAFPLDLAARLQSLGLEIWNLYGPTETTIWSSLSPLHQDPPPETSVSIGRPIANTTLYVLDSKLRLLPAGVPGDLYIGGEGVARGYLRRPSLTASVFLPDPFSQQPGARLYRTGDIARLLDDGRIECLGRTDHQTKLHGFRIELGEIEAVLAEHPNVKQAVAAVQGERLIAYLVPQGDAAPINELRQLLESRLPRYMVPAAFVTLSALPLTANGKVDRRALPDATAATPDTPAAPPSNAMEETLAAIWREVLTRDAIGVHDNFFDLGGHSLLLVQVQLRIRDRLGLEVGVMELFEYPNIAALAQHLDGSRASRPVAAGLAETRAQQRRSALQRRKAGS
jgi:amino acid adenylation domain-containing protein